jgi:hypothetical protein
LVFFRTFQWNPLDLPFFAGLIVIGFKSPLPAG